MEKALIVISLLALPMLASAASIGITPANIVKENLLPGSQFEQTMFLSKSDLGAQEIDVRIKGEIKEWITHPATISFSQNDATMRVPLKVVVPKDAPLGGYQAEIEYFVAGPSNVHTAFSIPLEIIVTNTKDFTYHVKHVNIKQENQNTIVSFETHNQGNSLSGPNSAQIEIIDLAGNSIYSGQLDLEETQPFTIEEKTISFHSHMQEGNYWVDVYFEGQGKMYEEKVFLEVAKNQITSAATQEQSENQLNLERFWLGVVIALTFISFIIAGVVVYKKN